MCFGCRIHLCVVLFNRRFLPAKGEWERIFRKHRDTGAFGGAYLFCAGSQKHSGRRHVPQNPYFINRAFHIGVRRLDCALCRWVSVINGRKKGKKMEYDEICQIMDINYQSAYNLLQRSLQKVRDTFGTPECIAWISILTTFFRETQKMHFL